MRRHQRSPAVVAQTVSDEGQSFTEQIAQYSAEFSYEQLRPATISVAKTIVLDTLGALFAAWPDRHPVSRLIGDLVEQMGGTPECTVLGRDFKAPAANAALANGTMGYAADLEGGGVARMHAAAMFVPTALVMGERERWDGKTFIAALCLAYDVAARVSEANYTRHSYPHSFHPSAVFGTFGAAAIAGRAGRLDADRFAIAYGLAGTVASGLMTWLDDPTEHSRSYVIGAAARNGVTAAQLAALGFGGPRRIFDPLKYNIFDAFSGAMSLEALTRDLGKRFYVEEADGFKRFPCCGDLHSGIEALLSILEEHDLRTEEIERITHGVKETRRPVIDNNALRSHCSQYILAVVAVERRLRWDDFLRNRLEEPNIASIAENVRVVGLPELADSPGSAPALVQVQTRDGRTWTKRIDHAKGRRENPLSREELLAKFLELADPVVGRNRALEIITVVEQLEDLSDVRRLLELMH